MRSKIRLLKYGDVNGRVGVEVISARANDKRRSLNAYRQPAVFPVLITTTYPSHAPRGSQRLRSNLRRCLPGRPADWELIVPRIYELGCELPNDLPAFHDQSGCAAVKLPDPSTIRSLRLSFPRRKERAVGMTIFQG